MMDNKDNGHHDFIMYSGILDHQGTLNNHDPRYKGPTYNILIDWEDGTQTWRMKVAAITVVGTFHYAV